MTLGKAPPLFLDAQTRIVFDSKSIRRDSALQGHSTVLFRLTKCMSLHNACITFEQPSWSHCLEIS